MRSSSMRFTSHSLSAGATGITRSAYPAVLTSAITFRSREFAPGTQQRLAARSKLRHFTSAGKPSCDGSTAKFRIVDLIPQHDVSADEQFSGSSYFGLWPAATLCQSFVETL